MIFSPNKFERYTAALRSSLHISVAKHGRSERELRNLRKIYTAEAIYFKNEKQPINMRELSFALLGAVYMKKRERGEPFEFEIKPLDSCIISPKLFTAVLLTVCKSSSAVSVGRQSGKTVIGYKSRNADKTATEVRRFGIQSLTERVSGNGMALIPCDSTAKRGEHPFSDFRELSRPLSPVDIFITD